MFDCIRVTGKGNISIKPDTIRLNIRSEETFPEYEETVARSTVQTKALREVIKAAGLNPKDLKTADFRIDTKYESYEDKKGNYKRRFVGYYYIHNTYIKFPNDNKQLGKILYALSHCSLETEFSFRYTISDTTALKDELLEKAVEDSTKKANVLAKAAGVKLGKVKSIDYSWSEIEIYSREMTMDRMSYMLSEDSYDIEMEADDIDMTDTVTLEWNIE